MDFLLSDNNLWILLIAVASGALLLWPGLSRGRPGARIAINDAVQQVNREHGQFIDVRPADQFKAGSIPQSRNIPMADLESHVGTLPKDKPLILVDGQGRDAQRALAALRKHGFDRVSSLDGGVNGWVQAGMPLKKS